MRLIIAYGMCDTNGYYCKKHIYIIRKQNGMHCEITTLDIVHRKTKGGW